MYARKEMLNKSKVAKESKKSDKKEKPKQKDDEEGLSGKELMALVKRKQRQGLMTGKKSTETEKKSPGVKDGAPERKKPRLSDGGDISPRRMTETPKKMRHPSDPRATPEAGETDPRRQARKRLREALSQRSKESKDLKMDLQSISMLVAKIEKQLHEVYKGPTKDYKLKYRQIWSNIKDVKNDYFWRNVLQGEISSSMLIRMSNQEMASKETMELREKQEKEDIERRKKIEEERQKEALKPTAKMTHKGEIEIDRDFNEPLEKTVDFDKSLDPKLPSPKKSKTEKKIKKEEKKVKKESISKDEEETIQRMLLAKAKPLAPKPPSPKKEAVSDEEIEEPKTPEYIPPDNFDEPSPQASPEHNIPSPEHALTPPPPATEISIPKTSSQVGKVWSGKISVPDTGTFSANGYIISGNIDSTTVQNSLQHQLKVGGRLDYEVVNKLFSLQFFDWVTSKKQPYKYIREVRSTSDTNRVSVMSLYGKSAADESGYIDTFYYLTQKNRIGVVNNFHGQLKDVYLVPVQEDRPVPEFLEPIDGIGLAESHPAIILCVMVKKSEKKKHKKPAPKEETVSSVPVYTPSVPEPPSVPELPSVDFNKLQQTLQTVNTQQSFVPSNPVAGEAYYDGGYTAAPPPIRQSTYHEYQPDSRDRDSRTFRPDNSRQSSYQPDRDWDRRDRHDRHRDRNRSRSGGYRNDYRRGDRRY